MNAVNELPLMDASKTETGCCPLFDPDPWNKKTFVFEKLKFAKASTRSLFYMPLNLGKVFTRAQGLIDKAEANVASGYLILSQDVTRWKADHYFRVDKDVPGLDSVTLSGTFMTRVFDAEFKDFPRLIRQLKEWIASEGCEMKDFFVFYTVCPKCAKHYGHNYMVFFGRISE